MDLFEKLAKLREALFPEKNKKGVLLELWSKIVSVIPLGAWLGVIGQSMILAKYHALPFFSWSQAVNDAVILSAVFVPVVLWWYYSRIDSKTFVPSKKWLFTRIVCVIVISIIACPLAVALLRLLMPAASMQVALVVLLFWMIGHVLQTTAILIDKGMENDEPIKSEKIRWVLSPAGFILLFVMAAAWLSWAFQPMYGLFYDGLKVEVWSGSESVIYMNDKYVLYWSGKIMANDDDLKFTIPPQAP